MTTHDSLCNSSKRRVLCIPLGRGTTLRGHISATPRGLTLPTRLPLHGTGSQDPDRIRPSRQSSNQTSPTTCRDRRCRTVRPPETDVRGIFPACHDLLSQPPI